MDPVPSPAFFDMTTWMAVPRNLITYKLLQFYGRTPTAREVDIGELQEAWNKDNPQLIPLVVDGMNHGRTEQALREWLQRLRVQEFVRSFGSNPWFIYYTLTALPTTFTLPATIDPSVQYIITDELGKQTTIQPGTQTICAQPIPCSAPAIIQSKP